MTTVATEPQAEQTRAHGDEPAWPAPTDLPAAPPWATAVTDLHWAGALDNYYHRGYHREWRSPRGGIWAYVSGNQTFHRDGSIEDDGVEMETFDATIESNADAVAYAAAIREATTLLAKINDGFFDRPNLPPAPDWCETDQVDQLDDELTGDRNFFAPTDTFSDHEGECVEVSGQVEQVLHKGVVVEQKAIVYVDVTGAAITPATARAVAAKLIEHADLVEAAVR